MKSLIQTGAAVIARSAALIGAALLSGCLLNDGTELIPQGSPAIANPSVNISAGLQPVYSWDESIGLISTLIVSKTLNPNLPVWGFTTSLQGPTDSVSSPVTHGNIPVDPSTGLPLAVPIGSSNELILQEGVQYRVLIRRESDGKSFQVNFIPPNGTVTGRSLATATPEVAAAASGAHTLAVKDGNIQAWGAGGDGQLGGASLADNPAATAVAGLTEVKATASGGAHSLALKHDGTVWAWGANASGQLGDGTTRDSAAPVQVTGMRDIVAVAAGEAHSLALISDGSVWAWGENSSGQLGDGTTANRATPVKITSLSGVTSISAGKVHSLAVTTDGTVWAWGGNYNGQLGDGTVSNATRPIKISLR